MEEKKKCKDDEGSSSEEEKPTRKRGKRQAGQKMENTESEDADLPHDKDIEDTPPSRKESNVGDSDLGYVAQSLSMNSVLPPLSVSLNIFWWKERHVRNSKCFFKAYPDVRHTFMFNTLCTYHGHKRTILTVIRVFYWYIDILFICFLLQAAMNSV